MFTFPNKWLERGVKRSIYRHNPVSECSAQQRAVATRRRRPRQNCHRVSGGFYVKWGRTYIRASITLALRDARKASMYATGGVPVPAGDGMTTGVFLSPRCSFKPSGWAGRWCRFNVSQRPTTGCTRVWRFVSVYATWHDKTVEMEFVIFIQLLIWKKSHGRSETK